jgi:hypothetical protein
MRIPLLPFLLLAAFPLLPALAQAPAAVVPQTPTPVAAHIVFTFEHPQLQPARYTISIDESGAGHFVSQPGPASSDTPSDSDSYDNAGDVTPAPMDRPIRLNNPLRDDLFRYARSHSFLATNCSRSRTNLAFTGKKTLSYSGPDGHGSCTFVWAADPALQRLSDELGAVAFTLEVGRRLDVEVRHDPLGLDAELESLQDAVNDQRAAGLANIAPELQAISQNQNVMNRDRQRALALLSRCANPQKSD